MSQSLAQLYVHIIFSTKYRKPHINLKIEPELYAYMGDTIKRCNSFPILINGTEDHVHIFLTLSKTTSLAKLLEEIKRNSSRWIKTKGSEYQNFAWQKGYGAFSVSPSVKDRVIRYIANQKQHHKKDCYKEELIRFFNEYNVEYDERYIWD